MARSSNKGVAQVSAPTAIPYRKSPWLEERDRKLVESAIVKAKREMKREIKREIERDMRREHAKALVAFRLGRELTKAEQRFLSVQLRTKDFAQLAKEIFDMSVAELLKWFDSAP